MKSVIILCLFSICGALCKDDDYFRRLDSIYQEIPCSGQGGMCTLDCPRGQRAVGPRGKNLCPEQRSKGAECCYGFSEKETRCQKRGGDCTKEFCNNALIYDGATDCPSKTVCCVRVTF